MGQSKAAKARRAAQRNNLTREDADAIIQAAVDSNLHVDFGHLEDDDRREPMMEMREVAPSSSRDVPIRAPVPVAGEASSSRAVVQPNLNATARAPEAVSNRARDGFILSSRSTKATMPAIDFNEEYGPAPPVRIRNIALNDNQIDALLEFARLNGEDAYSQQQTALGVINPAQFLAIPRGFTIPKIDAVNVGTEAAAMAFDPALIAQIYALNKSRCTLTEHSVKFALARVEAVKAGWLGICDQTEVVLVPPLNQDEAFTIFATDLQRVMEFITIAKMYGYLMPLMAEHTFRTMGHHFLSSDTATYLERYKRTMNACLVSNIDSFMPAGLMYHECLHWVTPRAAMLVLQAQMDTMTLPDALKIRASAPAAGTAIVTTTAAILDAIDSANMLAEFERQGGYDLDLIRRVTTAVKSNPWKYHKVRAAYGVEPPEAAEVAEFEDAKDEAIKFAPIGQAFLNTYLREADLAKAKALKKHCAINPVMMKKAERFFRELSRRECSTIADIFADSTFNADTGRTDPTRVPASRVPR